MIEGEHYHIRIPVENQARFTFVQVFRESTQYVKNYILPFNLLSVTSRSEGEGASVRVNHKTGAEYDSKLNDVILTPYQLPQQYRHTYRDEHLAIHFRLELYPGVDVFSGLSECIVENSPELRREAEEIFAISDRILMLSRCQEFALRFCHRHWPARYALDVERMKPFDEVLRYIRNSADALTMIDELARIMHRSTRTFTREFHAVFQVPPKTFLQNELYGRAARMLLSPEESVKSVAEKLKFSSEFYFSHFFKRLSGISPKEYRSRSILASGGK